MDLKDLSDEIKEIATKIQAEKKKAREEREREELIAERDLLVDDEFFMADNGLSEFKIKELGINDTVSSEQAEQNPHLQNLSNHNPLLV